MKPNPFFLFVTFYVPHFVIYTLYLIPQDYTIQSQTQTQQIQNLPNSHRSRSMKMGMGLVLLTVSMAVLSSTMVSAQTSSCTNVLISMAPCLNYITGNSSSPSQQCCRQLATVVQSSPDCLCQVLNGGGSQLGFNVNQTQALALPTACNVQTPPVSRCNSGSSADSPADSPNGSGPENGPGTGSKTVPTGEGSGSSDGSSIKLSFPLLVFLSASSYIAILLKY